MNKNDSRYFTTATLMDEAFLRLLEKKDFEYSNLKDKPIGFLKYLCKKHKIEL